MKRKILAGTTSFSLPIFVAATNSTTGGGLAGLVHNTSGLVAEYRRQGQATWTAITLASGKTLGAYLSSGFIADGALDGAYEIDVPNAAVAASARFVLIRLRGAANMLPVLIEIELDAVDYQTVGFGSMASYTQPTGFLATTFPSGTVANTTNITGGTITTTTTLTNLPAIPLTGPFTRTFTVTDSLSAPIEGAAIRLYRTGESESQLTNVSGVREFTTDAFTFTYAITKGGFRGTTGTIAVSANGSTPIALVANVIAPAAGPNQCDCAANLVLRSGDPAVGWLVTAVPTAAMQIVNNAIILPTEESQATDATGQAVLRLVRLVEYKLTARKRSIEVSWVRTVPNTATATITLQA